MKKIAITLGDTNSIGVEVAVKALNSLGEKNFVPVLIGSRTIFKNHLQRMNLELISDFEFFDIDETLLSNKKDFFEDPSEFAFGKVSEKSGEISYLSLKKAISLCKDRTTSSIVTCPVSKEALHLAGHKFGGQTEILEKHLSKQDQFAQMLFCASKFKVLLLTRHIPLKDVTSAINEDLIIENVLQINEILIKKFKIERPKIALCALNPHAGENGILGREEKDILNVASEKLRKQNIDISDCIPADTLFTLKNIEKYDLFISCYHDQGLIPMKLLFFNETTNVTVGLDYIRTSPSHGTAFEIAGKNIADFESMKQAISLADFLS